jgi:hypothetical protein
VPSLGTPERRHAAPAGSDGATEVVESDAEPVTAGDFIRGAWTAERMTLTPAAWNTVSNAVVKLASRSCRTNFTRVCTGLDQCAEDI